MRPLTTPAARRLTGTGVDAEFPQIDRRRPIGSCERCDDGFSAGGAAVARVGGAGGWVLGIGRTMLYELIRRGDLRPIRIGRCVRIPRRELEEFVERLVGQSQSDG